MYRHSQFISLIFNEKNPFEQIFDIDYVQEHKLIFKYENVRMYKRDSLIITLLQ